MPPGHRRQLAHDKDADAAPLADMVRRQVSTMRRQVDHYLSRARAAGSLDVLGNRTQVSGVMDDLARVIARIHADASAGARRYDPGFERAAAGAVDREDDRDMV